MYIESVPNRNSPPAILLRESYRENGKVRKRTLCNLSDWPTAHVEGLRGVLKGGTVIAPHREAFTVTRSLPHGHAAAAKAMDYMLRRWPSFTRFLNDGRICLTNNAAERSLRGIAVGRKAWLFAGSDRGGERAAAMYSLIATAKLNDVDPRAWLADVIAAGCLLKALWGSMFRFLKVV